MSRDARSVVFVLGNGGRGGMQAQVRLVAGELAAREWRVTIAVGGGGVADVAGVEISTLPHLNARWPVPFVRALRRECAMRDASVVHAHGLRLAPLLRYVRVPARVVTCHGLDPRRVADTARAVRRSPVTFVACGDGPRTLLAHHGIDACLIDNALATLPPAWTREQLAREFDLPTTATVVVLPARFTEQKNHAALLDALVQVRATLGDDAPVVLCFGDGPLRAEIEQSAARSTPPLLRCYDYRDDVSAILGAASFFLLTSTWEGQPLVVLEALARSLPVATTTPTGVADLIADGRNGRCVTTSEELAATIVEWTRNPGVAPRDPALTARTLDRHRVDVVVDAHERLYEEVSTRRPHRRGLSG